ncbi:NnrU protein [Meinhardsimonia xiamenensis]|jgi:uncharacterized membrane protein|uniref:NnrU protein n=1 Tax=Meinhardsimonia xiamenensis TaxID=990712 RepID=A0A1G9EIX2_9RHOB|nr:NnrU family protein [Meinhardsimonia xiamenensis]PRX33746.1 NnrU protein [Meinhardsimonia xiamenensis]SDK76117.1 NnrU protein [Meinhardsimonia xiamenensis]
MSWLVLGIALWWAGHLFKRVAPDLRASLGARGRGIAAAVILAGLVLMVIGYRAAPFEPVMTPPAWGIHANNLLMLLAVFLVGLGHSKSPLRRHIRHPMLTGVFVWATAHLLVNGDLASLVLFGSFLAWPVVEILLINAREPQWTPPQGGSATGTLRLVVISLVAYAAIAAVHMWLGHNPFPGA